MLRLHLLPWGRRHSGNWGAWKHLGPRGEPSLPVAQAGEGCRRKGLWLGIQRQPISWRTSRTGSERRNEAKGNSNLHPALAPFGAHTLLSHKMRNQESQQEGTRGEDSPNLRKQFIKKHATLRFFCQFYNPLYLFTHSALLGLRRSCCGEGDAQFQPEASKRSREPRLTCFPLASAPAKHAQFIGWPIVSWRPQAAEKEDLSRSCSVLCHHQLGEHWHIVGSREMLVDGTTFLFEGIVFKIIVALPSCLSG